MIRHIVAWNYSPEFSDEEKLANGLKVKEKLEGLKALIPEIVEIRVHLKQLGTSDKAVVLNSLFASEAALQAYQVHPEHQQAADFVRSVLTDRVCLDFLIT